MMENCAYDSREIVPGSDFERRLRIYVELLGRWRNATNLISDPSFDKVWTRHIADSAQLLTYARDARKWLDLGSGAGFPGMVIAIQLADCSGAVVHCIESNQRKAAFLRHVARETGARATVHTTRIELVGPHSLGPVDAVTARGVAALPELMAFANVWIMSGAIGVFPCGRTALKQVRKLVPALPCEMESIQSEIEPTSLIIRVRSANLAQL